jgi:hypothetical protein
LKTEDQKKKRVGMFSVSLPPALDARLAKYLESQGDAPPSKCYIVRKSLSMFLDAASKAQETQGESE